MADAAKAPLRKVNGKVIVAGSANCGKTCLVERFVHNVYAAEDDPTHGPTLGCDCQQKSIFVDNTEVQLYLYDTAGQERFAQMAASYYRHGAVCLLCFDMSNLATFDTTEWWMRKVKEHNDDCVFILVGCKEDAVADSSSELDAIMQWSMENGIAFFPTSALKGGHTINCLFHTVAEKCIRRNREKQLDVANNKVIKLNTRSAVRKPQTACCNR